MKKLKKIYQSVVDFQRDTNQDGRAVSEYDSGFVGAALADVRGAYKFGWADGVKRARELGGDYLTAAGGAARMVRRWADPAYDGIDFDPERARYEMPCVVRRMPEKAAGVSRGVAVLFVNIAEAASVSADALLWKAIAAARWCDLQESAGKRCEIWAGVVADSKNHSNDVASWVVSWRVKSADDPVNLGLICSCIAPWALRFWGFAWQDKFDPSHTSGRGKAQKIGLVKAEEITGGRVNGLIDQGDCLSRYAAENWIKEVSN
jgi:hypothetical protein